SAKPSSRPPCGEPSVVATTGSGLALVLDERLGVSDNEPVLSLSEDRDKVVLPQGDQRPVDRDGRLRRNPVRDATNDTPRGLREVTTEPDRVTVADTLTHERRATQETARTGNRLGNIVRGQVDVQRVAVAVDRTPEVRLNGVVEGEPAEALTVRDEETHTLDEVGVDAARRGGSGAERDGLGRLGQVVIERAGARPVTAEVVGDSEVERLSERTGEVSTDLVRDVARVRADNLSRHHNDRGELLRLDRQKV